MTYIVMAGPGRVVGTSVVGISVGESVGENEGQIVGVFDGSNDGSNDGAVDGVWLGRKDGLAVGAAVGPTVGRLVGRSAGRSLKACPRRTTHRWLQPIQAAASGKRSRRRQAFTQVLGVRLWHALGCFFKSCARPGAGQVCGYCCRAACWHCRRLVSHWCIGGYLYNYGCI